MRHLRHIVSALLKEAAEEEQEPGEDSLDSQIDRYLTDYESEAKNSKNEGLDIRLISRRLLREEGEDEEEAKDEEGGDEKKEDEKEEEEKTPTLTAEDIDVKTFASDVMRLVDNYDTLLEIRNTILRRAVNYLGKSYEADVVDSFKEELLESHGVEIGVSKFDKESEIEVPRAGQAGPMGGGGA